MSAQGTKFLQFLLGAGGGSTNAGKGEGLEGGNADERNNWVWGNQSGAGTPLPPTVSRAEIHPGLAW